ncbi:response regulator [Nibrella saemangeumensis]|uniref:Response regulator n=1 Tax=Nibrella saemangeumensis TaxID=1084526 RepID=A0ABP8MGM9_9BACT
MKTTVALVDDHRLLAQALADLIQKFENYEVLFVADSARSMFNYLRQDQIPDILLLDIRMPEMDGVETARLLKEQHPSIKVLVLTMVEKEDQIVKMIRQGARGYILKGSHPSEFKAGLDDVRTKGWHYSELLTNGLIRNLNQQEELNGNQLNDRELEFVKLACSDLTYVQIADKMCVAPRTVDGYRESVFQKWNVKSRVAMVIEAIRRGIFQL